MTLILLLIGCGSCGQTRFANTGLVLTIEDEETSLDVSGGELCGVRGSWGSTFEESLSAWPDSRQLNVSLSPEVGETLWPWEVQISMPWDSVRSGGEVTLEEGTLTGTPCYLTPNGCEATLGMTAGRITFQDMEPRHDPCDPFATLGVNMSWDLEFGEPGSEDYWVTSRGDDEIPVFIDFLCANP